MKHSNHATRTWTLAAVCAVVALSAQAQSGTGSTVQSPPDATRSDSTSAQATTQSSGGQRRMYDPSSGSFSAIPYSTNGYIGLNVGKPDWDVPCAGGFGCDESNTAYHLYTGGMFNPHFGAEIGYVDFGRMERAGGRTRAHGVNLSLVGHLPLGGVNLYAKLGTIYSRTNVTANALSGVATGQESGWEGSYGVGVGFNLSPRSSVVLEWNRYDLTFVGVGKRDITTTSLGYVHRF